MSSPSDRNKGFGSIEQFLHQESNVSREHLFELFKQVPAFVALLKGPDHVFELANPLYMRLIGNRKVIGKPVVDALPEVVEQGFVELLDKVYHTGIPYKGNELLAKVDSNGDDILEDHYINFVYQPFREPSGEISGIFVHGVDVTDQVISRQKIAESENKYRGIFNTIDQGFCLMDIIFDEKDKPIDYRFLEINPTFEKQTGFKNALGKTVKELLPDLEQRWFDIYGEVSLTGKSKRFTESSLVMGRWFEVYAFRLENVKKGKVAVLFTDITSRIKSQEALERSEKKAKEELAAITKLHELASQLLSSSDLHSALKEVLYATVDILGAQKGNIQLFNSSINALEFVANKGFGKEYLEYYSTVNINDNSSCARVIAEGKPVSIDDIYKEPSFETHIKLAELSGFRSVHSTPLKSRRGRILGVISIHFKDPHTLIERDRRILDLYCRQASDFIEIFRNAEELRQSELRFKTYAEVMPQMAFISDPKGNITYYNKRWYDYVGDLKETEKWGWKNQPVHHPDDLQRTIDKWQESLRTGKPYEVEYRLRRYDGTYRWHLGRAEPVKDSDGNIEMWLGTNTDIHTQKLAEEALKKSQEYYKTMTDNTPVKTWISDRDGNCTYMNKQWYEYTGQKPEDALFFGWLNVVHPDDYHKAKEVFLRANERRVSFNHECRIRGVDGKYRWHIDSGLPKFDENGNYEGFVGSVIDIHERKVAEERLKESEQYNRTLIESSPDCVLAMDLDNKILSVNSQGLKMLEIDNFKEYFGKDWLEMWSGLYFDDAKEAVEKARNGKIGHFQGFAPTVKGTSKWWDVMVAPVYSPDEMVERLIAVARDISQLKALEQQKDDFLGIASHELKTPVTSIKAYTQVLQSRFDAAKDPQSSVMLGKMDAQLNKLTGLISDLLDVTKIEQGKLQLRKDKFKINDLLEETVEEIQRTTQRHKIELDLQGDKTISGDRDRIGQVVTNLLTNAIKYSPKSEKIEVKLQILKEEVIISVKDYGLGLSEEDQRKVFERFYRVGGANFETFPGLGLGLFISAEIIHRHYGDIWVTSKKGRGSTFYFTLPLGKR